MLSFDCVPEAEDGFVTATAKVHAGASLRLVEHERNIVFVQFVGGGVSAIVDCIREGVNQVPKIEQVDLASKQHF